MKINERKWNEKLEELFFRKKKISMKYLIYNSKKFKIT